MPEPFEIQRLLWDLRHDPALAAAARHDLGAVLARYGLSDAERRALVTHDFTALLAMGVSPLLLFFGAMELGVARGEYYQRLSAPPVQHAGAGAR